MTDPMERLLQIAMGQSPKYTSKSRYAGIGTITMELEDGRKVTYLSRRFLPEPGKSSENIEHQVVRGDRLDNIAARYLGDPELSWRICDINGEPRPEEATLKVGRRLKVTSSEGGGLIE